jgi:hypothetical protein
MTCIITYALRLDAADSDEYYRTISEFAESWLTQVKPEDLDLVTGFREFRQSIDKPDRSDAEYLFELLALGVHLREHGLDASRMPAWVEQVMHVLVVVQNRYPYMEAVIKVLRGWLGWLPRCLPDSGIAHRRHEAAWLADQIPGRERDGDSIGRMMTWLGANDEPAKEKRFGEWHAYFYSKGEAFTKNAISRCLALADDFAETSREVLGKHTENVESFLKKEAPNHRHRYDARLLSSSRLEYHLGMLGTEILNRAYRQSFLATGRKMVILPPCMCAPEKGCKAVETPFGAKCQACTPSCRVNQITKLGEKRRFDVTIIPDDVKVFGSGKKTESIGLVGVSCALTNWSGGWDTGTLGIPAQGLLLDYVGCKFHWDKEGIPTDTNLNKLQEILDV